MSRIMITGANGFIGSKLCQVIKERGHFVRAVSRTQPMSGTENIDDWQAIGDICQDLPWHKLLQGIDCVIHLAARAHVTKDRSPDSAELFRKTNVIATERLVRAACEERVKCFIFLSSIGVNGSQTNEDPFREADLPAPESPYALAKLAAEAVIKDVCTTSNTNYVIIRPPLVYGFNAPGNFESLLKFAKRRIPLPFGSVRNRRDLIGVDNLCSIILECVENPKASNKIFLVSDGQSVSTGHLIKAIRRALGLPAYLFPCPSILLRFAFRIGGRTMLGSQVIGNLEIDSSLCRETLNWHPPMTLEQGLYAAVLGHDPPRRGQSLSHIATTPT